MILALALARSAVACSCVVPPEVPQAVEGAALVFQGRIVEATHTSAVFDVQAAWKGLDPSNHHISVSTAGTGGACGVDFEPGDVWVIYAHGTGEWWVSACSRSHTLAVGAESLDAAALGSPAWTRPAARSPEQQLLDAVQTGDLPAARLVGEVDAGRLPRDLTNRAVERCDAPMVELLVSRGLTVSSVSPDVIHCSLETVEELLAVTGPAAWTMVLPWAAASGRLELVEAMVQSGVSPEPPVPGASSALDHALRTGQVATARLLWEHTTISPITLERAANHPELEDLVHSAPAIADPGGLCHAAFRANGDVDKLQRLLDQGLEPAACGGAELGIWWSGGGPLHAAARAGSVEGVDLLVKAGASVDQVRRDGYTPLFVAAERADPAMVAALLEHGAAIDVRGHFAITALHQAAKGGSAEVVRQLVAAGADVSARADDDGEPLHIAAWSDETVGALRALLEAGADAEAEKGRHDNRRRPLAIAAEQGQVEIVRALLAHGSPPDGPGYLPLALAAQGGHLEVVRLLLEAGADPGRRQWDKTALDLAREQGHSEVAALLEQTGIR